MTPNPVQLHPRSGLSLLATLLTLLLGLSLSLGLWWSAKQDDRRAAQERFQFETREIQFAIQQRLLAYEQVLRGAVGLFAASKKVERDEWHDYVSNLHIEQNYPGIQGVGFAKWFTAEEREPLTRRVRAEGFGQFELWPQGERDSYSAILYLEPFDWRNQRAFGYDMYSEPTRREAMARARDLGRPAVSGRVKLVQETNQGVQHGFLMYLPVYPLGRVPASREERNRQLQGFVYSPFRINDLMRGTLSPEALSSIRLQIFDGHSTTSEYLLYDSAPTTKTRLVPVAAFNGETRIDFNGRPWTLRLASLPAFEAATATRAPTLYLFGGLLVSLLLAGLVWAQGQNRGRARLLAASNLDLELEIGERNKLEGELILAKDKAEAANQAKSDFLANVSHELRTPLTLILAPVEQLLAAAPADCRQQLERVQRNGLLLLNRVNDLLDFAKAEAGKFESRPESIELPALLAALAEDAALVARHKGCALDWHVAPELDCVYLDRGHLERILLNLLSNAIKFTPPGGSIQLVVKALGASEYRILVKDSGIGIAAAQLPLLFQRFQQVDNSGTRHYGGTGIGLALVKELVELMGGQIAVDSAPGQGACFEVRLPRHTAGDAPTQPASVTNPAAAQLRQARFAESAESAASAPVGEAGEPEEAAPRSNVPRVLVADDNPDMRQYLAELLRGDYEVCCAADGLEAWELLQQQPVDLVLADVMMPRMDGIGLSARIKASGHLAHLPVILVTARGGQQARVIGLECGADDYVAKPFAPDELLARLRATLRMSQIQRQLREQAHEAGMALQAAGLLHNLGNVLNGISVAAAVIRDLLRQSKVGAVRKLADLLQTPHTDLALFLDSDSQGQALPAFVEQLAEHLEADRRSLLKEVERLGNCVEHASGVLACQRHLARPVGEMREPVAAQGLLEDAVELATAARALHGIAIERDYPYEGAVLTNRHKVLQILLNLLHNAGQALADRPGPDRRIRLRAACATDSVQLEIQDNGAGIDPQCLSSLFNQNPSSKGDGHGYGLHLSANWARELGGRLSCQSDGPGRGARFTLELPAPSAQPSRPSATPLAHSAGD